MTPLSLQVLAAEDCRADFTTLEKGGELLAVGEPQPPEFDLLIGGSPVTRLELDEISVLGTRQLEPEGGLGKAGTHRAPLDFLVGDGGRG
jgi:hypothetical protein